LDRRLEPRERAIESAELWYSRRVRSQTGRGAFAWAILAPTIAFAEAPSAPAASGLSLRWSDPSALAATTEADFDARLSERLGHAAFNPAESRFALAVAWQGSPEQCRVELQLLHGSEVEGTRLLQSPNGDCRSLLPALLTVAALLIESRPGEPEPEPPSPPPAAPPPPPPVVAPKAETDHEPTAFVSLGAALGSGLAPKLELGPAAALVVTPLRHLRVGALGSVFFPHQYGASPGLSLEHESIAFLACYMPLTGAFNLGLCGNAAWHRYSSDGLSLPHPESHRTSEWTTGLAVRAEWRLLRHLWWVGHVGADVTPRPLYFYFTPAPGGESILFRQRRVAPTLFLGLTLELP
jgi:hypothetical protein